MIVSIYTDVATVYTDTVNVYLVNNIYSGKDSLSFINFDYDYSLYGDYNIMYHFKNYKGIDGTIIGITNDILVRKN